MTAWLGVTRRALAGLVLCACLSAIGTVSAQAAQPVVRASFYGVNGTTTILEHDVRARHLSSIDRLGLGQVRFPIPWYDLEPHPPGGGHAYHWDRFDAQVADMARRGIRAQLILGLSPGWAAESPFQHAQCRSAGQPGTRVFDLPPFANMTGAVARRYGRGGTFWRSRPGLPEKPVVRYEIWNEPNLANYWCPAPQPEIYGTVFVEAARRIRAVDRRAKLIVGGLADTRGYPDPALAIEPKDFLLRMTTAVPSSRAEIDAVGIHAYPVSSIDQQMAHVAFFREQIRLGGIPNSTPIQVNEFGWTTRGPFAFPEADRVDRYRRFATAIARTNCNVNSVHAHTWASFEQNGADPEHWFGIAHPRTGDPYASARAYRDAIALMRGERAKPPPKSTIRACPGMPAPDTDRDGARNHADDFPLNPKRR